VSPWVWPAVGLLGGVGAVTRFLVDAAVSARLARGFPWGTLVVNLTGATMLGILSGLALTGSAQLLAGTATLGAYTTFSTWMLESVRLAEDGNRLMGVVNVVLSASAGLAAIALGRKIGAQL
jgi:CrcB protein